MRAGLLLLFAAPTLLFLNARGDIDMVMWISEAEKVATLGPRSGYREIWMDYPPLASMFLGLAAWTGSLFGFTTHLSIKLSLLIALWTAMAVFWRITRNFWATILAYVALVLHGAVLAFLDTYYAAFLLIALAAFTKERRATFWTFYTLACLVKWQPLIMAPFFVLHEYRASFTGVTRRVGLETIVSTMLLPSGILGAVTVLIFGWEPIAHALSLTFTGHIHRYFSLRALNLPWIISHTLEALWPDRFEGFAKHARAHLIDGTGQIMALPSSGAQFITRIPFFAIYAWCVIVVWRSKLSAEKTLIGAVMGFLAYYIFNTGVHENHLLPAVVVALYLFATGIVRAEIAISLALMMNANMLAFDDLDGFNFHFNRAIGDVLDPALIIAIIDVLVACLLLRTMARQVRSAA